MTEPNHRTAGRIVVEGARTNNLRDVSLSLPKGRLTVFTGVSGSGKSSIVFDTIAVESQRQLNETYSWFLRNRLPKFERPDTERLANLAATIVVDQRRVGGNARSTVGTMTEIAPLLRVLFSRAGEPSAGSSNLYSFNDPQGMCPECEGLGRVTDLDLGLLLDESRSLNDGAIRSSLFAIGTFQWQIYAETGLFDPDKPIELFSRKDRELLLHGEGFRVEREGRGRTYSNEYEGIVAKFRRRYLRAGLDELKPKERAEVEAFVREDVCGTCGGGRLNPAALASRIHGRNIAEWSALEISELVGELERLDDPATAPVVGTALSALRRIEHIGLGYLSLDRQTSTLSGGEGQRLKTVRHLGSSLTDLIYVFDEPSVGLHPQDVHRLTELLGDLRDKGNTVLVVEHDRDVIAVADHVVDMGPGAGADGGRVVLEGTVDDLRASDTLTGRLLAEVPGPKDTVRTASGTIEVRHADAHNLRDVSLDLPAGVLTAVTGVAGSGKSTLITGALVAQHPGTVVIDQSSIGASARSTPATYVDVMDSIREAFALAGGVDAGLFSFNSRGACPECKGRGTIQTDLAFLDPVTVTCERCGGTRYNDEALSHRLDGRTVVDVLALTVAQALTVFGDGTVHQRLCLLEEVGLGYLTLGQSLSTLSGGERQRLKLAHRLRETGRTYVFDEPTTGLHMADVDRLMQLFDKLVDAGNTVLLIEHDLDVVVRCDWVVDLGPGAGRHGGRVLFEGTPRELAAPDACPESATATYLRAALGRPARGTVERGAPR